VCEVVEWKETRNCSKSAMKWRNMSEMSLATTIGLESNPFILFSPKQWCIEVFRTHQFISLVPEPRIGKVGWSSSSKGGSQGCGIVENDDEHYEIIGQMIVLKFSFIEVQIQITIAKMELKMIMPQPSSHQSLRYPSFQKQKWS